MGLDVNYKRKRGVKNNSRVIGLSNQVNAMSQIQKTLGEVFCGEGWAGLQWRQR